jgi:hypothetical protein
MKKTFVNFFIFFMNFISSFGQWLRENSVAHDSSLLIFTI